MPKYTEGERNLIHYATYGEYPAPPRQYQKQILGNNISTIVGDWYRGEREPRKLQRFPFLEEQERRLYPALFAGAETENWFLIGGLALFFLVMFGIVSFKGL